MSKQNNRETGKNGEEIAVKELISKGYKIIERNFIFGKGEIDIIAQDTDGYLVFVEVKYRANLNYGEPEYALTPAKQKQIRKVASAYLYTKGITEQDCRFDVISVTPLDAENFEIVHYSDSF